MRGPFAWDQRSYSYRDSRGRYLSGKQVRDAIDAALLSADKRAREASEALRAGRISLADWQVRMAREVKTVHVYSTAAARGGWLQMTQADYGRVGQRIRAQYEYLRRFAQEIASGKQRLDGTLVARATLYTQAGRSSYHATEQREMVNRLNTEERSVLHPADRCPGCVEEARRGWVMIGSMVPVGQRECRTRCRCTVAYR